MAGQVIYLPSNPQDAQNQQLFTALGQALGQGFQQADRRQAIDETRGMSTEDTARHLASRLGPEGLKLVEGLTKIRENEASIQQHQATGRNLDSLIQLRQQELAYLPTKQALEQRLQESTIAAHQAAAAGNGALVSLHTVQAQEAKAKLEQLERDNQIGRVLSQQLMGLMAPGQPGSGGAPAPQVQRQSGTTDVPPQPIPTDIQGGKFQPISSPGTPTSSPMSGLADPGFAKQVSDLDQQYTGGRDRQPANLTQVASGPGGELPTEMSPMDRIAVLGFIQKHDFPGAIAYLQKQKEPVRTFKQNVPNMPGFTQQHGIYPGSEEAKPIGGTLQDERSKPDPHLASSGIGAELWDNAATILKGLSEIPNSSGGDVLGGASTRRINQLLRQFKLDPIGSDKDIKRAYATQSDHAIIGIMQMAAGVRDTDALRAQLKATVASPEDNKAYRDQKFRATELTANVLVKGLVDQAIASGVKVPPGLRRLYDEHGLANQDEKALQQEYLDSFKQLGIKATDLPTRGGPAAPSLAQPPSSKGTLPVDYESQKSLAPRPKTQQEYDGLMKGQLYVGSDGQLRRKQ